MAGRQRLDVDGSRGHAPKRGLEVRVPVVARLHKDERGSDAAGRVAGDQTSSTVGGTADPFAPVGVEPRG